MRICSLLPSATEIAFALGLGEDVCAVTHECDFPHEAALKPRVTESFIDHERLTGAEIDHRVSDSAGRHGSIYRLRQDLLEQLRPDLILTQELCEVCAVSYRQVQRAAKLLDGETRIVSLEPATLNDVFDTVLMVGELTGSEPRAAQLVCDLRRRAEAVRSLVSGTTRPAVCTLEWLDPVFCAGHWVPEMVTIAGGRNLLGSEGASAERIGQERIADGESDVIVLMPCGFSLDRTIEEFHKTEWLPGWKSLPAVRSRQVYAVDGSSFFNRPGPRLVDGIEVLAEILHPDRVRGLAPAGSYRRVLD